MVGVGPGVVAVAVACRVVVDSRTHPLSRPVYEDQKILRKSASSRPACRCSCATPRCDCGVRRRRRGGVGERLKGAHGHNVAKISRQRVSACKRAGRSKGVLRSVGSPSLLFGGGLRPRAHARADARKPARPAEPREGGVAGGLPNGGRAGAPPAGLRRCGAEVVAQARRGVLGRLSGNAIVYCPT